METETWWEVTLEHLVEPIRKKQRMMDDAAFRLDSSGSFRFVSFQSFVEISPINVESSLPFKILKAHKVILV